jgi:hypothetical protein
MNGNLPPPRRPVQGGLRLAAATRGRPGQGQLPLLRRGGATDHVKGPGGDLKSFRRQAYSPVHVRGNGRQRLAIHLLRQEQEFGQLRGKGDSTVVAKVGRQLQIRRRHAVGVATSGFGVFPSVLPDFLAVSSGVFEQTGQRLGRHVRPGLAVAVQGVFEGLKFFHRGRVAAGLFRFAVVRCAALRQQARSHGRQRGGRHDIFHAVPEGIAPAGQGIRLLLRECGGGRPGIVGHELVAGGRVGRLAFAGLCGTRVASVGFRLGFGACAAGLFGRGLFLCWFGGRRGARAAGRRRCRRGHGRGRPARARRRGAAAGQRRGCGCRSTRHDGVRRTVLSFCFGEPLSYQCGEARTGAET